MDNNTKLFIELLNDMINMTKKNRDTSRDLYQAYSKIAKDAQSLLRNMESLEAINNKERS